MTVGTAEEIAINVSCKIEMTGNVTENIKKNISEYLTENFVFKGLCILCENRTGYFEY